MNENIKLFTSEAIQAIKDNKPTSGYKVLNKALDMAIEALQKQEPKKPNYEYGGYSDGVSVVAIWECPHCGSHFDMDNRYNYCPDCGQHLDWTEESPGG